MGVNAINVRNLRQRERDEQQKREKMAGRMPIHSSGGHLTTNKPKIIGGSAAERVRCSFAARGYSRTDNNNNYRAPESDYVCISNFLFFFFPLRPAPRPALLTHGHCANFSFRLFAPRALTALCYAHGVRSTPHIAVHCRFLSLDTGRMRIEKYLHNKLHCAALSRISHSPRASIFHYFFGSIRLYSNAACGGLCVRAAVFMNAYLSPSHRGGSPKQITGEVGAQISRFIKVDEDEERTGEVKAIYRE